MFGDCGLDRSYDICGAGGPFEYPNSISSNLRLWVSLEDSVGVGSLVLSPPYPFGLFF